MAENSCTPALAFIPALSMRGDQTERLRYFLTSVGPVLNADANLQDAQRFIRMMQALHACSTPVVARVQGGAFGGGVGLICGCDVVVASEQAKFDNMP
jgi:enoyl-CoA hydratase/carnithine racemase